jgi:hypothetical protein
MTPNKNPQWMNNQPDRKHGIDLKAAYAVLLRAYLRKQMPASQDGRTSAHQDAFLP